MLSRNSKIIRLAKRSHFTADSARSAQTELVLLHAGQPWNEFHAREFLKQQSALRIKLPGFVHNTIASGKLMNDNIRGCISTYKTVPSLETQVDKLAERLEESLDTVVPEFGPFRVTRLFQFDETPFTERLEQIKAHRSSRYIFMPLYPHFSSNSSGTLLAESAKVVENGSSPLMTGNKEIASSRVEQNSDYSFDVSAIWRWDNHSILPDYWSSKIKEVLSDITGVVFVAPRHFSCNSGPVHATCERTMDQLGNVVPWRLAFYSSWDSFDLPSLQGVSSQVRKFEKSAETGKVAIVPITDVIETFDTFYTVPRIAKQLKNTIVLQPSQESEKLVHGISEIVKNRLLGRVDRQLEAVCSQSQLKALKVFLQ